MIILSLGEPLEEGKHVFFSSFYLTGKRERWEEQRVRVMERLLELHRRKEGEGVKR